MPLISVIVPTYNVEPYLHRCIDSILSQTFTDFELILVDDGSLDRCPEICDEYASSDCRIHVIHQRNGGLSAARNAGLDYSFANSDTQWISFVDSDDWIHPSFLEYLYRAVQETNTKVSACEICRVESETGFCDVEYQVESMPWDKFYLINWTQGVVAWNKLYKKDLFAGLRYPIGKIHEDEYLTYKLLDRAGEVSIVHAQLYFYFQNPTGIIHNTYSLSKLDIVPALKEQCGFAKRNGYIELYQDKRNWLLFRIVEQIELCKEAQSLDVKDRKRGLQYLRSELRALLFKERKAIALKKDKRWYYELAYPRLTWCYWTCVGIFEKIKRMVKRDA